MRPLSLSSSHAASSWIQVEGCCLRLACLRAAQHLRQRHSLRKCFERCRITSADGTAADARGIDHRRRGRHPPAQPAVRCGPRGPSGAVLPLLLLMLMLPHTLLPFRLPRLMCCWLCCAVYSCNLRAAFASENVRRQA